MKTVRWWLLSGVVAVIPLLLGAEREDPLRFVRIHVPRGSLGDVDLGTDRYVPMSAREFEEAVSRHTRRARDGGEPVFPEAAPILDMVRYEAALVAGASSLGGTATWTIGSATGAAALPLGRLAVQRARMDTAAGIGDALVHGRADGSLAIAAPRPGTYVCEWRCGVDRWASGESVITLPLVPALASAIRLRLPSGLRPVVADAVVARDPGADAGGERGQAWRIDVGPRSSVDIELVPASGGRDVERMTSWTSVAIVGRQARMRMVLEPETAWKPPASGNADDPVHIRLLKDRDLVVTGVELHAPHATAATPRWWAGDDGGELVVRVPAACLGHRQAFIIDAVAPFPVAVPCPLPLMRVSEQQWGGGGVVVQVDASQVMADIELEQALVVPADAAAAWRIPVRETSPETGVDPPRVFIEQQGPQPTVRMAVRPRTADVSVRRVTVVDVSPDAVLARATCDMRVEQGEAFEVQGTLTKGWVIDTVEVLAAAVRPPLAAASVDAMTETPEWRVVPVGEDNRLRVAFAAAITPLRPVMLRITGHRGGIASGTPFTASEIDMVRLDGEAQDAVLAVKTGAEMTIDAGTEPEPVMVADPTLAALTEDSGVRVRVRAGSRGGDQVLRLARRRPPIDVSTEVRLTTRDGRLVESFTFACTPERNEIDSIVVHFSTVMDDRLEWSLLPPNAATLVARRVESPDRRGPPAGEPIADTWVIELSPPVRQPVTIRAACTVAFTGPTPVPIAWVDGATRQHGTVTIREAGRFRPRIINHRLAELPSRDDASGQASATVAEFSFDAGAEHGVDALPAAEIVPGGGVAGEDARAWAWREETSIWCHASGATEYETRFDLENQGRAAVAFTLPAGLELQGAMIDDHLVPWAARGTGGGDVAVELPPGRRSLRLVVRAMARRGREGAWWSIGMQGGMLDVPVLQRNVRLFLAPDVEIAWPSAAHRVVEDTSPRLRDWSRRLFNASLRSPPRVSAALPETSVSSSAAEQSPIASGYREYRLVPVAGRRDGGSLMLFDGAIVRSVAILAAGAVLVATVVMPPSAGWLVPCLCMITAIGALWIAPPFAAAFRAAWWGALAGTALRAIGLSGSLRRSRTVAVGSAALLLSMPSIALADESVPDLFRVFITPASAGGAGAETALVPEALFRRLAGMVVEPDAVRIMSCALTTGHAASSMADAPWTMVIDVDADGGAMLRLDQGDTAARIIEASVDGRAMPLREPAAAARIPLGAAGRHRVVCRVAPAVVRRGQVEMATLTLPVAPRASLTVSEPLAAVSECDLSTSGGPFLPAPLMSDEPPATGHFDISRASAVRVVRPIDHRLRLAPGGRVATSRNDLFWDLDACRANVAFDMDLPNEIVRSFIVRVEPGAGLDGGDDRWRLEAADAEALEVMPLGGSRYLVERRAPTAGAFSARLAFRWPLIDPVGVFAIPGVWIEGAVTDSRMTQISPAADLMVDVRIPDNATAAPRDSESSLQSVAWRTDAMAAMNSRDGRGFESASRPSPGTITVRRRRVDLRATQRLMVDFAEEQVGMQLHARIDGGPAPIAAFTIDVPTASVIDRVHLFEERRLGGEAGAPRQIDIAWSRLGPGQVRVVVQQPREGRCRLEAEARVPGGAATRGTVAVMRVAAPGLMPIIVDWISRDGRGVAVAPSFSEAIGEEAGVLIAGDRAASGTIELTAGEVALHYERGEVAGDTAAGVDDSAVDAVDVAPTDGGDHAVRERVELADVSLVLDERGRCWGSARFDVITASPTLRVELPPGMRLFEAVVDGRQAGTIPRDDGRWEIPLMSMAWPRSVLVVFAGDIGPAVGVGRPVEVRAPSLIGLPCDRILWTIQAPEGVVVRVADPARVLGADDLAAAREAAFAGLSDAFGHALEKAPAHDRRRLEEFVALRRNGSLLPAERPWVSDGDGEARGGDCLHAIVEAPSHGGRLPGLTLRASRRADPTARSRAVATLLVVLVVGLVWNASRWWPACWDRVGTHAVPGAAALAGVLWLVLLDPAWPGVVMLGAVLLGVAFRASRRRAAEPADESTITQFAPPAGIFSGDLPSTRHMPVPPR